MPGKRRVMSAMEGEAWPPPPMLTDTPGSKTAYSNQWQIFADKVNPKPFTDDNADLKRIIMDLYNKDPEGAKQLLQRTMDLEVRPWLLRMLIEQSEGGGVAKSPLKRVKTAIEP